MATAPLMEAPIHLGFVAVNIAHLYISTALEMAACYLHIWSRDFANAFLSFILGGITMRYLSTGDLVLIPIAMAFVWNTPSEPLNSYLPKVYYSDPLSVGGRAWIPFSGNPTQFFTQNSQDMEQHLGPVKIMTEV
ncbi:hypothetical protein BdWA1_003250 [Babesia duncani]|uniref:Uncharacterized protein n=1 Tax=Babesia duncani TaxID=323732 RepID=A0AAD9PIS6_9APIC|nr:hypothetical protein BdWA1_003250 [Babesia duncani]